MNGKSRIDRGDNAFSRKKKVKKKKKKKIDK